MENNLDQFITSLKKGLEHNSFVELTLTNKRNASSDLKRLIIKRVKLKSGEKLSFVYRHDTKDITKNYAFTEAENKIKSYLQSTFSQAALFTLENDHYLTDTDGKVKVSIKSPTKNSVPSLDHNKQKVHVVNAQKKYLQLLSVTNAKGEILKAKHSKFRQINKFIELVSSAITDAKFENNISFIDMGSGLGYLTFALYDHLMTLEAKSVSGKGVELRSTLVEKCNNIASDCGYTGLSFEEGSISDISIGKENMLIALHACDTATDDAIAKGIQNKMKVIICSPCCHKQVRKSMSKTENLKSISKHGILKERQAEIVTDTIRALIMEAHGYKTKVVEFISSEHTSKNLMIIGVKVRDKFEEAKMNEVKEIKKMFGVGEHQLETILKEAKT